MPAIQYVCPSSRSPLSETPQGLRAPDDTLYPFVSTARPGAPVPSFAPVDAQTGASASMGHYVHSNAHAIYDNFLDWLFATFRTEEAAFRADLAARLDLKAGANVLVTGCGLGDDIPAILAEIGPEGRIYAQDLSPAMVLGAERRLIERNGRIPLPETTDNVRFFIGDATRLPFEDAVFDAALHFGGINEFDDRGAAIAEMARVVRPKGRVCIGDEGVAPWLRNGDYGRMMMENNPLWRLEPPIALLPEGARDVALRWVLGNCFYVLDFAVADGPPNADIDIRHQGRRGGSIRTRYWGRLEGVDPALKDKVAAVAGQSNEPLSDWIEAALRSKLNRHRQDQNDE